MRNGNVTLKRAFAIQISRSYPGWPEGSGPVTMGMRRTCRLARKEPDRGSGDRVHHAFEGLRHPRSEALEHVGDDDRAEDEGHRLSQEGHRVCPRPSDTNRETPVRLQPSAIRVHTTPRTGCFITAGKFVRRPQVEAEHQEHDSERRDVEHQCRDAIDIPLGAIGDTPVPLAGSRS